MGEHDTSVVTRRQAVAMMGMGMAMTAASGAQTSANPANGETNATGQPALQNPRSKYPEPPFKKQTQAWPGLASRMEPKPDHGETSYKGSGRLAGRKALITGGDHVPDAVSFRKQMQARQ